MPAYWFFNLAAVAERVLYREAIKDTADYMDVWRAISYFRSSGIKLRPRRELLG
jgi:hypothetical protein